MSEGGWFGSGSTRGRAIPGGFEFELGEVTSQARVYKQKLRDLLTREMSLAPSFGEFDVAITIELNPNYPAIDLDNVAKAVLDGIKGHIFVDDSQVMRLLVEKRWAEGERVVVVVIART